MTTFPSAMTSDPNESKLSLLCLKTYMCPSRLASLCVFHCHRRSNATPSAFSVFNHGIIENRFTWLSQRRDLLPLFPPRPLPSGHVFNMPHDNVKACEEVFGKLKDNHMMSPTLIQIDRSRPWSVCSAAIITEFLDRGHGW